MYPKFITKEEINALPMLQYSGEIHLIDHPEKAKRAVLKLKHEKVLGFDTETRPSFRKGEFYHTSLLQLATKESAYLFRLNVMSFLPELAELLSQEEVLKVGVGIHDDLRGLQKMRPFEPKGFVDLSKEAEKRGFESIGLRPLTAIFLQQRLSKAAKVTNWDRKELTEAQLLYAASDAYVGLQIYEKISVLP